ncbi:hypothetical protein ACHQM5_007278 [Ranunculus cassubicifolius]
MHSLRIKSLIPLHHLLTSRHFSAPSIFSQIPSLSKIPSRQRKSAVLQAQQALSDYLHTTRCLSFTYAENISKNSLYSLSNLISKVSYTQSDFGNDFKRFLRYHPLNEFEFFFESIGIPMSEIDKFLPIGDFFLSDEGSNLNVAHALTTFGFPWNMLGKLYVEESSIFGKSSEDLISRVNGFVSKGFDTCSAVGICLAFPCLLSGNDEIDALFECLRMIFIDCNLKSKVEGNVDASYEFGRKIRFFVNLGCDKNEVGELIGKNLHVFFECSEKALQQKFSFFQRLDGKGEDIGMLLLRYPEILSYDLENRMFSLVSFLKQFGMTELELNDIVLKYPYVMGKNRLENLPHSMKALNLHEWFFHKIINGNHHLLADFDIGIPDEDLELEYRSWREKIQNMKNYKHAKSKLSFLLGIGFGENLITIKAFQGLHGTGSELQERFNYLLELGIEFSKLCKIINMHPKALNQAPEILEDKIDFLCNEIGSSVDYLEIFPGFLGFNLENRIKPRYRIHKWLTEIGAAREYSISSLVATSENAFVDRLMRIHPTVMKQWLERFSSKEHCYKFEKR